MNIRMFSLPCTKPVQRTPKINHLGGGKGTSPNVGKNDSPKNGFEKMIESDRPRVFQVPSGQPSIFARIDRASKTQSVATPLRRAVEKIAEDERRMEKYMRRALNGRVESVQQLISLQVTVYRYSQQVEVLSKMVDRTTQAVKQTLQTPV